MKFPVHQFVLTQPEVTPHAGVWIEILKGKNKIMKFKVTPHAGVWIEMNAMASRAEDSSKVTPHAGVWIEMGVRPNCLYCSSVTPHAGVWIEIWHGWTFLTLCTSHPPRGGVD